jgi:uncharacterized protein YlxW (UPF0749 family)
MPAWLPRSRATGARPHRLSGWTAVVPVAAAVAGLLFATSAQTAKGTDLRATGRTDLVDVIRSQTFAVERQAASVQRLQAEVDQLTARSSPGSAAVKKVRGQADRLAPLVGTEPVSGPGLKVTLDDAKRTAASLPDGFTADDIVVHQQDVQSVVNALWAGGAEAMMLQDQRVISTSAVRCVGNTLLLQGRVYSPPYVITAVGDVTGMRQKLDADPSVTIYRQYADLLGLRYDVEDKAKLSLPAYAGSLDLVHARAGG